MSNLEYQLFYERHLPHIQPPGATMFIAFRLANSIPSRVLEQLVDEAKRIEIKLARISDLKERAHQADLERRKSFGRWDKVLDSAQQGPFWLRKSEIAGTVSDALHTRNGRVYELESFCIMPNHVHLVCTPSPKPDGAYHSVSAIMHSLKRYTARQANLILHREGAFWQHENYDHVVRNEAERNRIIKYVLNNPISAGLVQNREDWKWSHCKYL